MKSRLSLLGLLLWLLMPSMAWSQASVYMCVELTSGIDRCQHVSVANPLPVTGSFSATTTGFHEESVQTPITATTGGVSSAAFTAGKVVVVTNAGTTNIAYCQLGASATTSGQPIAPNGGWFAFTSTSETLVTCATSTSTTTVNFAVGTGLPTGTGGGGGSSGGGGAITAASGSYASGALSSGSIASGAVASGAIASGALAVGSGADGWDVSTGITTATAASVGGTGSVNAKLRLMTSQLDAISTAVAAAIPAGTNYIGDTAGKPNVTPTDCSGTIASGGAAQNAFTAASTRRGFVIANIDTSEVLWFSLTTTAAASGTGSYPLAPATATTFASLSSYFAGPGSPNNTALSVIGATTSHKFSCTVW